MSLQAKIKPIEQDESLMDYADLSGIKITKYNKTTFVLSGKFKIFKPFINVKVIFSFTRTCN